VTVDGADIHYQDFSPVDASRQPGLLFVHGHGAHAHWWDFIAPAFIDDFHVIAIDLSGSGDSQHRKQYNAGQFAREMIAVTTHAGLIEPVIVAHSFGGTLARVAAWLNPGVFRQLVLVDSVISSRRRVASSMTEPSPESLPEKVRFYDTLEAGQKRFRLRPPQPCDNAYILAYIARYSLKQTAKGYCFKLDQRLFAKMIEDPLGLPDGIAMVEGINCPVYCIYGRNSRFFGAEQVEQMAALLGSEATIVIDQAHHHVFLDQPLAFIQALQNILKPGTD
jgi:pimeloyl-ACP methyl ester carboxylesterase